MPSSPSPAEPPSPLRAASTNARTFAGSLRPGAASTPLDTSTAVRADRRGCAAATFSGAEPSREHEERDPLAQARDERPVERHAGAAGQRLPGQRVSSERARPRRPCSAARPPAAKPLADADRLEGRRGRPARASGGSSPWSCRRSRPAASATRAISSAARVDEDAHPEHGRRQRRADRARPAPASPPAGSRPEHEADRVGPGLGRDRGVRRRRDAADLDERAGSPRRPRAASTSPPAARAAPRPGRARP